MVAIKLNRGVRIDVRELDFEQVKVSELWMFGATQRDQSTWSLFGDCLWDGPLRYDYELPYA